MHTEFCEKSQAGYEKVHEEVASIETKVNESKQAMAERVNGAKESLSKLHASRLSFNERRILGSIDRFTPSKMKTKDQNDIRLKLTSELKKFARDQIEKN